MRIVRRRRSDTLFSSSATSPKGSTLGLAAPPAGSCSGDRCSSFGVCQHVLLPEVAPVRQHACRGVETSSLPAGVAMISRTGDEERTALHMMMVKMLAPIQEQFSPLKPTGTAAAPTDGTAVRAPAGGQSPHVVGRAQFCVF